MALIQLMVVKRNGRTLSTPTLQLFDCNDIADKAVNATQPGNSTFIIQKPGVPVPNTFEVQYTVTQIQNHCNGCCTS